MDPLTEPAKRCFRVLISLHQPCSVAHSRPNARRQFNASPAVDCRHRLVDRPQHPREPARRMSEHFERAGNHECCYERMVDMWRSHPLFRCGRLPAKEHMGSLVRVSSGKLRLASLL